MHVAYAVIASCLLGGIAAHAAPLQDATELRVATIVVPPLVTIDKATGTLGGAAVERLQAEADRCGLAVSITVSPSWNRAYTMAQAGTVDGLMPTNFSEDRAAFFDFPSSPLVDMSPALVVRTDSPHKAFTGLDILKGKRVGVRTAALLEDKFDAYVRSGEATLVERSNSKALVDELLRGEVDFIADSFAMIDYYLESSRITPHIRELSPPLGTSGQYLALSKKRRRTVAPGTPASSCLLANSGIAAKP